jgi:putative aldouronate transport system permease protein
MATRTIKPTAGDRVFNIVNYGVLSVIFLIIVYPLVFIVSSSFSSTTAVISGQVWLYPVDASLDGYKAIFRHQEVWVGYGNSLFYAVVGTAINIFMTVFAAYPLSRKALFGKKLLTGLFVFTLIFNGGLIPYYLVVKATGILNTRLAMLLPQALQVWNMIIALSFFRVTIPDALYDAAEIDGASDFMVLWKVVFPLSGPIIAVLALFYAVYHWNAYFEAMIFLKNDRLYPLQIILRLILIENQVDADMMMDIERIKRVQGLRDLLKYSLIVVASGPVLAIYPFVQKYFVRGVMIGALKG